MGFPCASDSKESDCNEEDPGSICGSGRSPGEGHGYPLHYSCLENPMDRGAWRATVHGIPKSTTEQPALSLSLYSWASQVALVVKNPPANADVRDLGSIPGLGRFPCRVKWQLTLVFLPGKSHEQRSLTGYSSTQSQRSEHDGVTNTFSLFFESKMKQVMSALLSSEHCNENHGHLHT